MTSVDELLMNRTDTDRSAARARWFVVLACSVLLAGFALSQVSYPRTCTRRGVKAHIVNAQTANRAVGDASTGPLPIGIPRDQPSWKVRYTLRLRLETGVEESVVVTAPPGGLQLVMRDMTGDHVPNDVVVIPALFHWPLTVLVNNGDQFTVAILAKFSDSSASDQDQASGTRGPVDLSALLSAGFEHHALTDRGGVPLLPRQEGHLPSIAIPSVLLHAIRSGSGRAPPSLVTSV